MDDALKLGLSIDFNESSLETLNIIIKKIKEIDKVVQQSVQVVNKFNSGTVSINNEVSQLNSNFGKLTKTINVANGNISTTVRYYKDVNGIVTQVTDKVKKLTDGSIQHNQAIRAINNLEKAHTKEIEAQVYLRQKLTKEQEEYAKKAQETFNKLLDVQPDNRLQGKARQSAISMYAKMFDDITKQEEKYAKKSQEYYNNLLGIKPVLSEQERQKMQNMYEKLFGDIESKNQSIGEIIKHNVVKMGEWLLAGKLLVGTIRSIQDGFKTMLQLETEAVNIQKVLPEENNDVRPFEESAIALAKEYGQSVIDVEQSMASWARRYKEVNDVAIMTRASLLAATATDITFAQSVTDLSSIMAEWNMETKDAIHVVDVLNTLSNNYRTTASDVAAALSKSSAAAKATGLSFEELSAIVATGVQVLGIKGEEMGTFWTRVMARMKGNKGAKEAFADLGIDPSQSLSDMLSQLMTKWDGLTQAQKQNFAITVAGTQYWSKFIAIMDNYDTVLQATIKSYFSQGSAQKEIDNVLQTTQKKLEQLNATWQEYIYKNSGVLIVAKGVIDVLRNVVSGLNATPPAITATIAAITSLTIAYSALSGVALRANKSIGMFLLTFMKSPLGIAVTALTAIGTALYFIGANSNKAANQVNKINEELEETRQKQIDYTNQLRGIQNVVTQYQLLEQAITDANKKGQDATSLKHKLSLVHEELAKALGKTNDELHEEIKASGNITEWLKKQKKEYLDLINLQRQSIWLKEQEKAGTKGMTRLTARFITLEQINAELKKIDEYEKQRAERIKKKGYAGLYGWDYNSKYENPEYKNELLARKKEMEKYLTPPEPLTLEDIIGENLDPNKKIKDDSEESVLIRYLDLTKEQILAVIEAAKDLDRINKIPEKNRDTIQLISSITRGFTETIKVSSESLAQALKPYEKAVQVASSYTNAMSDIIDINNRVADAIKDSAEKMHDAEVKFLNDWEAFVEQTQNVPDALSGLKTNKIFQSPIESIRDAITKLEKLKADNVSATEKLAEKNNELRKSMTPNNQKALNEQIKDNLKVIDEYNKANKQLDEQISKLLDNQEKYKEMQNFWENLFGKGDKADNISDDLYSKLQKNAESLLGTNKELIDSQRELKMAQNMYARNGHIFEGYEKQKQLSDQIREANFKYLDELNERLELLKKLQKETNLTNEQKILVEFLISKTEEAIGNVNVDPLTQQQKMLKENIAALIKGTKNLKTALIDYGIEKQNETISKFAESVAAKFDINNSNSIGGKITSFFNAIGKTWSEMGVTDKANLIAGGIGTAVSLFRDNLTAQDQQDIQTFTSATSIGAQLGGPWGAVAGGVLGLLFSKGNKSPSSQYESQSDTMKYASLLEEYAAGGEKWRKHWYSRSKRDLQATIYKMSELIGASVDDLADGIANAFNADNYIDFLQGWGQNLEDITRQALIKAFIGQEAYQAAYKELSKTIVEATMDGVLSAEEIAVIRQQGQGIAAQMQALYKSLGLIESMFPDSDGSSGSSSRSYSAGVQTPIVYNNYITINSQFWLGDEDSARQAALYLREYLVAEQQR